MGLQREVVKWGNSLGVRIPNKIFQMTQFKEKDTVEFLIEDENTLLLKRTSEEDTAED